MGGGGGGLYLFILILNGKMKCLQDLYVQFVIYFLDQIILG